MLTQQHTKHGIQFVQLQLLNSMTNEPRNFPAASLSFVWLCVHRGSSCISADLMFHSRTWSHPAAAHGNRKRNRLHGWDLENKWYNSIMDKIRNSEVCIIMAYNALKLPATDDVSLHQFYTHWHFLAGGVMNHIDSVGKCFFVSKTYFYQQLFQGLL